MVAEIVKYIIMNTKLIYLHVLAIRITSPKFWLQGNAQFIGDNKQTHSLSLSYILKILLCKKTVSKVRNLQINTERL